MIIIKFMILGLIVLICSKIGNIKAKDYNNRYLELKKFKRSLGIFRSKLDFTYETIGEIFQDISKIVYEDNENIFKEYINTNDWNMAVDKQSNLKNEDKEVLKGLGKMLGKLDKEGQLSEIYLSEEFVDRQIELAFEEKQKNEKMYKILGKCIGIAIAIVLI